MASLNKRSLNFGDVETISTAAGKLTSNMLANIVRPAVNYQIKEKAPKISLNQLASRGLGETQQDRPTK